MTQAIAKFAEEKPFEKFPVTDFWQQQVLGS